MNRDQSTISKNTAPDESTKNTSRRGFITGSAAAWVGATTVAVMPTEVKAGHLKSGVHEQNGDPVAPAEHTDPALPGVILRAWNFPGWRQALLNADHAATKQILENEGVGVSSSKPKVISQGKYNAGYTRAVDELVYVLPDYPDVGGIGKGVQARVLMAAVPFGM